MSFQIFPQHLFNYFLYDLNNEEENEFLAALDLEAVNVADIVHGVTAEEADKRTEANEHRFVNQPQEPERSSVKVRVKGLLRYPIKCVDGRPQPSHGPAVITS